MGKKTRIFLLSSVAGVILLGLVSFMWMGHVMGEKSSAVMSEVSGTYMREISDQLEQKFSAIIDLQRLQLDGIIKRTPEIHNDEQMDELRLSASVREFQYLGLYTTDGKNETVYGDSIEITDEKEFRELIDLNNSIYVSSAFGPDGEKMLLLATAANYPMSDGSISTVLVAGLPIDSLRNALVLEDEGSDVVSHIIRSDGAFVIRSGTAFRDSYFTRIEETYENYNGMTPELYIEQISASMAEKRDYTTRASVDGEHWYLYCSNIPNTEWYLLTTMPQSTLDDAIRQLDNDRLSTMTVSGGIILASIIAVFCAYFVMSRRQMKELDAAKLEAEDASRAKSDFLSSMSHDIRTPMNGIVGMTAIAVANIDDKERVRDCLGKIALSSKHLLGLINDVLDMSKIESGKLLLNDHQVSLRETMESIVNIAQPQIKAKKQHFDIFIQEIQAEEVHCDSVRLNQVLINLLSNAIKFTPEGGSIRVYLRQEDSPMGPAYVRCHFTVTDTGIGMTPEFQKQIFEKFTREKKDQVHKTEGSGLGMAIVKAIVDTMHGDIQLSSAPGRGSSFHIVLDLERAQVAQQDMVLPPWRMLVVDNDEALCQSAVTTLKEIGISAEWTTNGADALEMVRRRHSTGEDYQIVLLDWCMPDMDGEQTSRAIREVCGDDVTVLIISAYDWSDIEDSALAAGAQGFIAKPLFKSSLYLGLSKCMLGAEEKPLPKKADGPRFSGYHVLLAEDNDLNWEIAHELLSDEGFILDRAENGKVCVEMFEASAVGSYDVILMDIRMPVMNGYDAARAIRALQRPDAGLPIIAMTADALSEDVTRSLECGMNGHVAKPIDMDCLLEMLQKYLPKDKH